MSDLRILEARSSTHVRRLVSQEPGPVAIVREGFKYDFIHRLAALLNGIFDFDGTLAQGVSHWLLLSEFFPSEMLEETQRDRQLFAEGRGADNGVIFEPWQRRAVGPTSSLLGVMMRDLERIRRAGVSRADFQALAAKMEMREGSRELLGLFGHPGIVSAGIRPVIESFCSLHDLEAEINALEFHYDADGRVVDYDFVDVISDMNKGAAVWTFLCHLLGSYSTVENELHRTLIIGDSQFDRDMFQPGAVNGLIVPNDNGVLRGGDMPTEELWQNLMFVYRADTFLPLVELIKKAREQSTR
jgi:hypothetical protein